MELRDSVEKIDGLIDEYRELLTECMELVDATRKECTGDKYLELGQLWMRLDTILNVTVSDITWELQHLLVASHVLDSLERQVSVLEEQNEELRAKLKDIGDILDE